MAQLIIDKKIKDFKKNDYVQCFVLLKDAVQKTSTNGNKYMDFTLADSTGSINAKLWDAGDENVSMYPAGVIVKVRGNVTVFNNQPQFKIEAIRRTNESDVFNIEDFIPTAPVKGEEEYAFIMSVVEQMGDRELADFVKYMLEKYKEKVLHYPAAKRNHHSCRDGLIYHSATMLRAGMALAPVYPFLNKDLLYAGIILHDIGKTKEMDVSDLGLAEDYTDLGKLIGHINEGVTMVAEAANETNLNPEKSLMLQHMILSHHYLPEYGSPKKPMIPEAEVLHYLDNLDATLYTMKDALEKTEPGTFSEKLYSIDNRVIYKPSWN